MEQVAEKKIASKMVEACRFVYTVTGAHGDRGCPLCPCTTRRVVTSKAKWRAPGLCQAGYGIKNNRYSLRSPAKDPLLVL
jgi:hypothetical protein